MKALAKALEIFAILTIAANAAGLAFYFWLRPQTGLYRAGERFPVPSGYLLAGKRLAAAPHACYLLRVTATGCEYCRQDRPEYQKLAGAARRAGCESLEIAPKPAWAGPAKRGRPQLEYVDMALARVLVPYITPQTILLGGSGAVAWYRTGAMNQRSLRRGLADLRSIR